MNEIDERQSNNTPTSQSEHILCISPFEVTPFMHRKVYCSSCCWYFGLRIYDLVTLLLNTHLHFKGDNFVSLRHGFLHTYNATTKEQSACAMHNAQKAYSSCYATSHTTSDAYIQGAMQDDGTIHRSFQISELWETSNTTEKIYWRNYYKLYCATVEIFFWQLSNIYFL